MGRRKIQIAPITDDRNRNVTFGKRRNGLFKKAYELGVLCSVDVAVLVWGHNGKLFAFSSQGSLKGVVDRYHSQSQDECDVIGPAHYGGEINPSTLLSGGGGGSEMNGLSGSGSRNKSGGGVKKRRRSDDDSDDDDDDDDDGDDGGMLDGPTLSSMSNSNQHGLSTSAPGSSLPHDIGGLFPNGSPSSNANMHRYNQSPQHHQQQHQNQLHQQAQHLQNLQQAQQHPHSALSSHPFFGNYPYPGYPHHMPNVNPALGNPLGFYAPSAAAMAAAAAATGQYGAYGSAAALPPHLLRAATVAQQYAQQETGSSGSTPSSAGNVQNNSNGNGNSAGYAPIVRSPPPMDMSQQQQQQQGEGSSNGYGNQSQQQLSPRSGGGRKPSLHLSFSSNNNHQSSGRPSGSQGPSRNSSMNENDNSQQHQSQQYNQLSQQEQQQRQQQQQQHAALLEEAAVVSAYAEQAGLTVPGVGNGPGGSGGMQFPDSFLTSPSQLFPEIYRSMNSYAESQAHRAMTFGAENTPTADEDEGDNARNVFRWPTLGGSGGGGGGVSNGGTSSQTGGNGGSNINGSNTPRSQAHSNSTTDTTSHLRINGQTEVKREADGNESDTIAELAMS